MEAIQLNEIDFSKLEKAEKQGSKSTVFVDGDNCYKILDDLTFSEKIDLYYKFQAMEKDNVEHDLKTLCGSENLKLIDGIDGR